MAYAKNLFMDFARALGQTLDMTLKTYFKIVRVLAAVVIVTTGILESIYNPGLLDLCNGAAIGLVIYALWRA